MLNIFKKITPIVLISMMLIAVMAVVAAATPFREQTIGAGTSYIEATWFDTGVGADFSSGGGDYIRPHEPAQTEVGGSGFVGNIGWTEPGEWVQYTVNVVESGVYRFYAYLASANEPGGNIMWSVDGREIGRTTGAAANGWQSYNWYIIGETELSAGTAVFRLDFPDGNTNIAAIRAVQLSAIAPVAATASTTAEESMSANGTEAPSRFENFDPITPITVIVLIATAVGLILMKRKEQKYSHTI